MSKKNNQKFKLSKAIYKAILPYLLILLATIGKLYYVSHTAGPGIFYDETYYKENAYSLATFSPVEVDIYPPVYSAYLSLGFLFHPDWYQAMLWLNVLAISLTTIPIYLLSKRLLSSRSASVFTAVIFLFLPSTFVYPTTLMAENLSPFLFVSLFYLSLYGRPRRLSAFTLGLLSAALMLTKYLFFPAVVILAITYVRRTKVIKLIFPFLVGLLSLLLPTITYYYWSGFDWFTVVTIARSKYLRPTPPTHFALWVATYLSYWLLSNAFYLPIMMARFASRYWNKNQLRFYLVLAILTGTYLIISIRHSWVARYNAEMPSHLLGRYLFHLTPLMLIGFLESWQTLIAKSWKIRHWHYLLLIGFYVAISIGYGILFQNWIWELTPWFATLPFNSPGTFYLDSRTVWYLLLSCIVILFGALYLKFKLKPLHITWVPFFVATMYFGAIDIIQLPSLTPPVVHSYQQVAHNLADYLEAHRPNNCHITYDIPWMPPLLLRQHLEFWSLAGLVPCILIPATPNTRPSLSWKVVTNFSSPAYKLWYENATIYLLPDTSD